MARERLAVVVRRAEPRSHADEVRARIAAEHEAARALREANPEREPTSARFGSRCPICLEEWDVNDPGVRRRSSRKAPGQSRLSLVPSLPYPTSLALSRDFSRTALRLALSPH